MTVRTPRRAALAGLVIPLLLAALSACGPSGDTTLGEAYVAPATLNLRRELTQKTGPSTQLKHGDHLKVIDVKRRYVKVRTDQGEEGWLDSSQLLSVDQMAALRKAAKAALTMPSQGAATVYEALNVHIDPSRQSPSFTKIPEGGSVDILAHKLAPKAAGPAPANALSIVKPQAPVRRAKKEKTQKSLFAKPPKPPAPKLPDDWKELSAERIPGEEPAGGPQPAPAPGTPKKVAEPKPSNPLEDWTLVRTKDHLAGWVLTRNLTLSIPDEVAQYAEGKRIAAYFDLGAVQDEEKGLKHNWLWAIALGQSAHDFDAMRIFTWNRRRHRYETAWRERDIEGYFPMELKAAESGSTSRQFSAIVRDDDGKYWLRTYVFDGTRARLTGKEPYTPASQDGVTKAAPLPMQQMEAKAPQPGWASRQWTAIKKAFGK